ncbi:MAG TPA: ribosome-associated translation inhibitor RaiA [Candidatus Omnitrophota bacterium]|nr:ribosome-associated translation inhibitor RaiA [Candidatus Omnitrophota bacterium]
MQFTIQGHGTELSKPLREYAAKKLQKLEGFYDGIVKAQVVLDDRCHSDSKRSQVAEVSLWLSGKKVIRASEAGEDMYAAIDLVTEELGRQVKKHKEKHVKEKRREGEKIKHLTHHRLAAGMITETGEPKLAKLKRFDIKAMTKEEAMNEIEKLGHEFFMFRNAETEEINVLHKNKLIEPSKMETCSEEEAAKHLASKGSDFLSFINSRTNEINVIYKRRSGNLGLIEPAR